MKSDGGSAFAPPFHSVIEVAAMEGAPIPGLDERTATPVVTKVCYYTFPHLRCSR